jgi:hypothetical protein
MSKMINNPSALFGYTAVDDAEGNNWQIAPTFEVVGSVAVAAHDAVSALWDETTRTLKVEPWDVGAGAMTAKTGFGVALDAGAAGTKIRVVIAGFAFVNVGTGTATIGYAVKGTGTKGEVVEDTGDASDIAGEILGSFLGNEDGTRNVAPMWVWPR